MSQTDHALGSYDRRRLVAKFGEEILGRVKTEQFKDVVHEVRNLAELYGYNLYQYE